MNLQRMCCCVMSHLFVWNQGSLPIQYDWKLTWYAPLILQGHWAVYQQPPQQEDLNTLLGELVWPHSVQEALAATQQGRHRARRPVTCTADQSAWVSTPTSRCA